MFKAINFKIMYFYSVVSLIHNDYIFANYYFILQSYSHWYLKNYDHIIEQST